MIIGEEEIPNERALLTQEDGPMMASSASVKYIVIHCSATRSTCNLQIFLCLFLEKLNMPQNTPVTKAS